MAVVGGGVGVGGGGGAAIRRPGVMRSSGVLETRRDGSNGSVAENEGHSTKAGAFCGCIGKQLGSKAKAPALLMMRVGRTPSLALILLALS
eukprot:6199193-Pleurochrysis_carterae.AAC.1